MPGPTNTLLIEGSFSELADEFAQYLDTVGKSEEGAGIAAEIEPLLNTIREAEQGQDASGKTQKQKDDVLKKIVTKATVLNRAPEKEFTAAYNLLINLTLSSTIRDQLLSRICQYLSDQPITGSPQYGASLAITTLTTIFNVLPLDSDARYHVFLAILKVIKSTTSGTAFEALIPQVELNIPSWLSTWQLDDEDARSLYTTLADVAITTGHDNLTYKYLLSALQTVPPQSASGASARSLAKRTLVASLTNPNVNDFTALTASDAIQALRKSDSSLFELLEIFSSDDYSSYQDFLETNDLSSLDIPESAEQVLDTKIRLLTLASMAAGAPNRSLPYSNIASALQISSEDVEMWVIDTIRAGLIEGKLSQLKQEFLVQRATYRLFGEKQWAEIQGRLMVWRRSLESVLTVLRAERERFLREGPGSTGEDGQQGQEYGRQYQDRRGDRGGNSGYGGDREGGQQGGRRGGGRGGRGQRNDQRDQRQQRMQRGEEQQQQQLTQGIDAGGD